MQKCCVITIGSRRIVQKLIEGYMTTAYIESSSYRNFLLNNRSSCKTPTYLQRLTKKFFGPLRKPFRVVLKLEINSCETDNEQLQGNGNCFSKREMVSGKDLLWTILIGVERYSPIETCTFLRAAADFHGPLCSGRNGLNGSNFPRRMYPVYPYPLYLPQK